MIHPQIVRAVQKQMGQKTKKERGWVNRGGVNFLGGGGLPGPPLLTFLTVLI